MVLGYSMPKILYFHKKITKKGTLETALPPFGNKKALKIGDFASHGFSFPKITRIIRTPVI